MKYLVMTMLAFTVFLYAENPIDRGSWKIDGSLGALIQKSDYEELLQIWVAPQLDYYFSENLGVGFRSSIRLYQSDSWEMSQLYLAPVVTYITEKPAWPVYLSLAPTFFQRADDGESEDIATGYLGELGAIMFLTKRFALIPNLKYEKDPIPYYSSFVSLNLRLGYFFHASDSQD